jgi:hypothetical protein
MNKLIMRFRVWLANKLIKLAIKIRPKELDQLIQSLADQMIYGTGVTRIDPKEMYRTKGMK